MPTKEKIALLKEEHKIKMQKYTGDAIDYTDKHGDDGSEYLLTTTNLAAFHLSSYKAIRKLERTL